MDDEATPHVSRRAMLAALPIASLSLFSRPFVSLPFGSERRDPAGTPTPWGRGGRPLQVRGIHQVTLSVTDLSRSVRFYQALFGAPLVTESRSAAVLRIGGGPQHLVLRTADALGPQIHHFGLALEGYDRAGVLQSLRLEGIEPQSSTRRPNEIRIADPNGLIVQLMDARDCGSGAAAGERCGTPIEPGPGPLALRGMSHLTIRVPAPTDTNAFYQGLFGFEIQAYQAASPLLGVGTGSEFLMFIASGQDSTGAARPAQIHHACLTVDDFDVERVQRALETHGVRSREEGSSGALEHWISMRMPNRGGAPDGTPELYFSDPDGLAIQLQDASYCGGGGYLGEVCG